MLRYDKRKQKWSAESRPPGGLRRWLYWKRRHRKPIPSLQAERDYIKVALDERERSEHFRLKLAKRLLERKRG